ncbi:hypothetical protein HDU93_004867 [Gonapodya sp. JEL0774]|nr:hypothetical protein HDU93_004867 [Gonapodya sp. JEL0774]
MPTVGGGRFSSQVRKTGDIFETRTTSHPHDVFISGAASGMGLETARLFVHKGWFVVGVDVNESSVTDPATGRVRPGLHDFKDELGQDNVHVACVDVSKKEQFDALIDELEVLLPARTRGTKPVLDIVFANAGIGRGGSWPNTPWQNHLDVVAVNFVGVMITIYSSLRLMKSGEGGLIFSTSSASAMYGFPGVATYSATKHAVKGLTEALSIELAQYGIRVADTLPGLIDTPLLPASSAKNANVQGDKHPFRVIQPNAVANVVWASWINDPDGTDALGDLTRDRIHWYVPEELQVSFGSIVSRRKAQTVLKTFYYIGKTEIDAVVNTRGGAEKIREHYDTTMWKPMLAARKAAAENA